MRLFDRLLTKLLFAAMGFLPAMVSAQHLVYAEYYIDDDPGQGAAQSILPCDGVFDEAEEDFCVAGIATPSLDDGRHVFVLRMKDSEDRWGMRRMEFYSATSSPYAEKTLTAAEYFIDFDPGEGNGTELPASDGFLTDAIEHLAADSIASAELTLGWHTLYARVRDSYGVWSVARQVRFRVDESNSTKRIVAAECFVDTDPGVGKGMPLVAVDGSFDESLEAVIRDSIATGAFCAGDRTVYVRFCDNWSFWKASNGFTGWGPAAGAMLQVGSCCAMRGDANHDGSGVIDIVDLVYMVNYMFKDGPDPLCLDECNVDGSGECPILIDIVDLTYMVNYMFKDGPDPVACP